jgi:flavin reductase (DIM6/NTAB) family NADH-FMN oxidoreductase RutF
VSSDAPLESWLGNELNTPMFIVTASHGGRRAGCLISFASQCSVKPIRFAVFLSRLNHTFRVARDANLLGVQVVPADARRLAELFGGETSDDVDKFSRCEWRPALGGVPILKGCSSWFVGSVAERFATGDHDAFILDPIEGDAKKDDFLGFLDVCDIRPGHPI